MDLRQSENASYLEAEKRITDAFFALLEEKGFEEMTVSELICRAGVNRSTFYRHFRDKYDIVEKMQAAADPLTRELLKSGSEKTNGLLSFLMEAPLETLMPAESRRRFLLLLPIRTPGFDLHDFLIRSFQELYDSLTGREAADLERDLFAQMLFCILCRRMAGDTTDAEAAVVAASAALQSRGSRSENKTHR